MSTIRYLDKIQSPKDVQLLNPKELAALVKEIRKFLIKSIAETGGHLASNLGVVELTVALHYCFNSPKDKIIFDVGHQSYTHKLLTGRLNMFSTLRQHAGLSGFPKPSENEHDSFGTGHSSTAISAALGFAVSRDIQGLNNHVVAIVGDGSMTNGLSFEGLNNAGSSQSNLLVILNDNQMSISKNVGALSRHLNEIRTAKSYIGAKERVLNLLNKLPSVGGQIGRALKKIKKTLRYTLFSGALFEEMGFRYIGPVDGNNLHDMIHVLNIVKQLKGPVLLHVCTKKGLGYNKAENAPGTYHGVECFDIETGEPVNGTSGESFTSVFGKSIVKLAEDDNRIVAVSAAMPHGTGLNIFAEQFPTRFYDVGIAESHAVTFAAGLAAAGLKPVVAIYSTFLQRAYDQILHDVCLQNLPVIFAIDRAGLSGADGETHQGIFDISFLSHIPNLTVMAPKNGAELTAMLEFAVQLNAPVAIRYPRANTESLKKTPPIKHGKHEVLAKGDGIICIVALGSMVKPAVEAVKRLKADGINPTLINARFVQPLDKSLLINLRKFETIYTIEENVLAGGLGERIAAALCVEDCVVNPLALPNSFAKQGSRDELLREHNLDANGIYKQIIKAIKHR